MQKSREASIHVVAAESPQMTFASTGVFGATIDWIQRIYEAVPNTHEGVVNAVRTIHAYAGGVDTLSRYFIGRLLVQHCAANQLSDADGIKLVSAHTAMDERSLRNAMNFARGHLDVAEVMKLHQLRTRTGRLVPYSVHVELARVASAERAKLYERICGEDLSVRETKRLAAQLSGRPSAGAKQTAPAEPRELVVAAQVAPDLPVSVTESDRLVPAVALASKGEAPAEDTGLDGNAHAEPRGSLDAIGDAMAKLNQMIDEWFDYYEADGDGDDFASVQRDIERLRERLTALSLRITNGDVGLENVSASAGVAR